MAMATAAPAAAMEGPREGLRDVLAEARVGAEPLGDWLGAVDVHDCLADDPGAADALDGLRRWWIRAREERGHASAARMLDRRARRFSDEGRDVARRWILSRDDARQRWWCEDGLPLARHGVAAEDWVDDALALLASEARRLLDGAPGDRDTEVAVAQLRDLRDRLDQRFAAQFAAGDDPGGGEEDRYFVAAAAFEADVLAPMTLGWTWVGVYEWEAPPGADPAAVAEGPGPESIPLLGPILGRVVAWADELTPNPPDMSPPEPFAWMDYEPGIRMPLVPGDAGLTRGMVGGEAVVPGTGLPGEVALSLIQEGGDILDPRDAARIARIVDGWRRLVRGLRRDLRDARDEVQRLEGALGAASRDGAGGGGASGGATSDRSLSQLATDAERARRRHIQLLADADRLKARIQGFSTGAWYLDEVLQTQHVPGFVDGLERTQERAATSRDAAEDARVAAVAAGGAEPNAGLADGEVDRRLRGALGDRAVDRAGELATPRVAPPSVVAPSLVEAPGPAGDDRVLRYDGPLPAASPAWSDAVVARLLRAHPDLDATDARILLGMIARAGGYDRAATEDLVTATLDRDTRLDLRGGEAGISELDALPQRPEVTFELRLRAE